MVVSFPAVSEQPQRQGRAAPVTFPRDPLVLAFLCSTERLSLELAGEAFA